ncbi:MAG: ferredoxin domain-containing protein, partial [Muribaculaceae bacterium]|nr:ferredoxin domain-containing protein [Muribaculaceae bacterium]
ADKPKSAPCAFNAVDTGIAVGSAVSVAADMRVDTRVMYSIGVAAMNLRLLGENVDLIFGIPLSCSSKNPFFDRQP